MSYVATQNVVTLQKCSNYYILPCNCIDIYRQNVVIYYKTGYYFLTSVALM